MQPKGGFWSKSTTGSFCARSLDVCLLFFKVLTPQAGTSIEDISWCGSRLFSTGLSAFVVEHDLVSLKEKVSETLLDKLSSNCNDISV